MKAISLPLLQADILHGFAKWCHLFYYLVLFCIIFLFYPPWKHQKTKGIMFFSEGMKREIVAKYRKVLK